MKVGVHIAHGVLKGLVLSSDKTQNAVTQSPEAVQFCARTRSIGFVTVNTSIEGEMTLNNGFAR